MRCTDLIKILLLLLCIKNLSAAVYSYSLNHTHRYPRQAPCSQNSFRCASGQCVLDDDECDGKVDCMDGSDETDNCKKIPCNTPHVFKCTYGGCVSKKAKCDGKKDCRDNSDEQLEECPGTSQPSQTSQPPSNNGCTGFKCDSGECISGDSKCDGVADCTDASDENRKVCAGIKCVASTYTCAYGACVNKNARCNGIPECHDRSDEESCPNTTVVVIPPIVVTPTVTQTSVVTLATTTTTTTTESVQTSEECRLPESPPNGIYTLPDNSNYTPGSYVNVLTTLSLKCEPGFMGSGPKDSELSSYCINGGWHPDPPKCVKRCNSLFSTPSTKITCKLGDSVLDNCENPIDGTIAEFRCADFYEGPGSQYSFPRECYDGSWDYDPFQCRPMCGTKNDKAVPNVIKGGDAIYGSYPWQVGVYKDQEQICGGAILTRRVVLSAAHCFTIPNSGNLLPKENYMIAAGKYYRTYNHPNDTAAQYSEVRNIHVPPRFKGSVNHYEADIAVVLLESPFTFSFVVQPVCIDITNSYEYEQLVTSNKGWVSGWGQTAEGENPSEVLKELDIPFIDYNACYAVVPGNFKSFLTHDKICGGYLDEGKSVCRGDSGGALSFKSTRDNKYYIRGIISLSATQIVNQCNSNLYSLFTKVSTYKDFINRHYKLADNRN